jgi:homoserine kinase
VENRSKATLPASAGAELSGAMVQATADAYFRFAGVEPFGFSAAIKGDVPRSRGLGSSVTVRLGLAAGLNLLAGEPLDRNGLLDLTTELEGHPDNAAPAVCGGFAACGSQAIVSVPVKPRLTFVVLIPDFVLETKDARRVLPAKVSLADAVLNVQNAAVITAAFCSERYEVLRGAFQDKLHEPYRAELIPGFYDIVGAAEDAGALGAFLSGAGSSIMALVLDEGKAKGKSSGARSTAQEVADAMQAMAATHGLKSAPLLLKADNLGVKVTGK